MGGHAASVAQVGLRPSFPFARTDLFHALSLGRSKGRQAVQDRGPDLQFSHLPVEVTRAHRAA